MIDGIEEFISSLERFDAGQELKTIVENNRDYLVELQQQQLAAGIDIHGSERRDEYRPFTIKKKQEEGSGLGAVIDHVTFYMTGGLYNSLVAEIYGDEFVVKSNGEDYKYDKMIERIGEDNYGLDEESRLKFGEERVLPQFGEVLKLATGLELEVS